MFDFDGLEPQEKRFKYRGAEYVVVEASEGAATQYRDVSIAAARYGDNGRVVRQEDLARAEPVLVAACVFKIDGSRREPVTLDTVLSWPARVVKPLFQWIERVSELEESSDTVEGIDRRIALLQKRRSQLTEGASPSKNGHGGTGSTSASPAASA